MNHDFHFQLLKPDAALSDVVESFGMLCNLSDSDQKLVVLPDGRIDLLFYQSPTEPLQIFLLGLETHAHPAILAPGTRIFSINFKLLAAEYIFHNTVSNLLNTGESLPSTFWNFTAADLNDFSLCCQKAAEKISSLLPAEIDTRKQNLLRLIYSSNGALTVKELSEKVYWSSRQINRYFNQQFGISLKAYCSILRFRASFKHISEGKLFPEENFTDQNHFIKNIKKYAGVTPKILSKDERFINITALRNQPFQNG